MTAYSDVGTLEQMCCECITVGLRGRYMAANLELPTHCKLVLVVQ